MAGAGMPEPQAKALARALQEDALGELATNQDLSDAVERLTLRLTLLFGAMLVAAVGILLAAIPLVVN
jgi:hypothetical protein